jgi:carbohydrate-selective porin OprB
MTIPLQSLRLWRPRFWALLFPVVSAYALRAQQTATTPSAGWLDRPTLTGDWAGVRTALENAGVKLRAGFTTESAANPAGGQRQTVRYTQQVDFGADLDLAGC